jgi:MFS family permease
MTEKRRSQFFYGYLVVAGCFAIQGTGIGAFYTLGVFFKAFLAEFGWSRATISGASSGAFLLGGLLGIVVGKVNDRFGPRLIMAVTGSCFGLGLLLMSQLSTVWQLYVFYGLIVGIGLSSIDVIALTTTARWFVKRRGMMTGIVKVGTGTGQLIIPLMTSILIATYGWRTSYIIIGALVFMLLVSSGQLLRRDPGQKGLLPDGDEKTAAGDLHLPKAGVSLREAALTRQFWMICVINLISLSCLISILIHIVPHAMDLGIPAIPAAGILSTIGGVSMVGRMATGIAIDRFGNKKLMIMFFLVLMASLLWLQVAKELWMLYVFAVVYAIAHGGLFTVISPIVAELFGIGSHGVLFGIVVFSGAIGGGIGPVLAGHIFDIIHSYQVVFFILTGFAIAGLILTSLLRPVVTES